MADRTSTLQTEIQQRKPFCSLGQELVVGLLRTADLVRRAVDRALAPHDVTPQQYNVLRILRGAGEAGLPTPEGLHRDGVDYVLVLLVNRRNIRSGTTTVHDLDKRTLGSFTLTDPLDAALVDDARCYHGVTPVEPENPAQPAYRDVLVVTFRKKS